MQGCNSKAKKKSGRKNMKTLRCIDVNKETSFWIVNCRRKIFLLLKHFPQNFRRLAEKVPPFFVLLKNSSQVTGKNENKKKANLTTK